MTTTTNFGFIIPDGTDNVNLLTQNYPNWTNLDAILKAIKDTGITAATATKTGANFAVVRSDADCKYFGFVALSNYDAGDTFTVDGVPVTATTPAGTSLPQGAFVINQCVLACLNGAVLTVYVSAGATTIDAEDVNYDNTGSGLTAADVQAAIDELVAEIGAIPVVNDAGDVSYDNTGSGLTATNVQAAIDELAAQAGEVYSTTEKIVGKWINNETIYQKSYEISNPSGYIDSTLTKTNCRIIAAFGSYVASDGNTSIMPVDATIGGNRYNVGVEIDGNGMKINIGNITVSKLFYTVKYIKIV